MKTLYLISAAIGAAALTLVAAVAAGAGGVGDWPLVGDRFGSAADWISASVNAAIVAVTLLLAERALSQQHRAEADANRAQRRQALDVIDLADRTIQATLTVAQKVGSEEPGTFLADEARRDLIASARLLSIWEQKALDADIAFGLVKMHDLVDRVEIFMRPETRDFPFGIGRPATVLLWASESHLLVTKLREAEEQGARTFFWRPRGVEPLSTPPTK